MTYTTALADKIGEIHAIPAATLTTWRQRGQIPKRYFHDDGSIVTTPIRTITADEKYRILRFFECDALNFSQFKAVTLQQLADLERGKGTISKSQYIAFKRELADLHNICRPLFATVSHEAGMRLLKEILKDPRLKHYKLHENKYVIECIVLRDYQIDVLDFEEIKINLGLIFQSINL